MLFATHYHPLTTEFSSNPNIKLGYMTAAVADSQALEDSPSITFLYRLKSGTSPQSYGLQVTISSKVLFHKVTIMQVVWG